jgi:hypothetical protein
MDFLYMQTTDHERKKLILQIKKSRERPIHVAWRSKEA